MGLYKFAPASSRFTDTVTFHKNPSPLSLNPSHFLLLQKNGNSSSNPRFWFSIHSPHHSKNPRSQSVLPLPQRHLLLKIHLRLEPEGNHPLRRPPQRPRPERAVFPAWLHRVCGIEQGNRFGYMLWAATDCAAIGG